MESNKRRVISLLVDNQSGVLARVSNLFCRRGFNIDSLTVSATNDPAVSRITVTITSDDKALKQLILQASREAAVERLRNRHFQRWPEMNGLREGPAAALAFNDAYAGDRVAALVFGLLTMVDAAFEHKQEFYVLDSLNEVKLFNSARNMEVAIWKLGHDRNAAGELFLLSNELDPANRNLSYEREFGRVMGLLDFMAKIVADRNGRGLSRLTHSVVSTLFLPVSFLK